jgi:23S rRNA pseudouridine2457 synthase
VLVLFVSHKRSEVKAQTALFAPFPVAHIPAIASRGALSYARARMLIAFHKPYGVISQFTPDGSPNRTLAEFGFPKNVYAIGRLDADSEGLLLLSDEAELNERLLHPKHGHRRTYWAQVERVPGPDSLQRLVRGLVIQGEKTLPCRAWLLEPQPEMPRRDPPIRFRKNVPDCWIALELVEGRNRQVRRMTAAIGHPTLRLVRVVIGNFELGTLIAGQWRELTPAARNDVFAPAN